jgi:hypothetical protein
MSNSHEVIYSIYLAEVLLLAVSESIPTTEIFLIAHYSLPGILTIK